MAPPLCQDSGIRGTRITGEFPVVSFLPPRLRSAKRAFVTRRADLSQAQISTPPSGYIPITGDLVLAQVRAIGHQNRIELVDGRRSRLFLGDEIIVCYGNRYAPDQYEGVLPTAFGECALIASGGLLANVARKHARIQQATRVKSLAVLTDVKGGVLNLAHFALPRLPLPRDAHAPRVIAVLGTSMNSGKTSAAAHLIRGLCTAGLRVAAFKATGTGSGGDLWHMIDAGALQALDFSDAGWASTYRVPTAELSEIFFRLLAHSMVIRPDVIVFEVADGIFQRETAAVLGADWFREHVHAAIFAAPDAASLRLGVELTKQQFHIPVCAATGLITLSPLAVQEAKEHVAVPVLTLDDLENPEVMTPLLFKDPHPIGKAIMR